MAKEQVQRSLFEEDFLLRAVPASLTLLPDVALTELVANAWDAGASKVEIQIPEEIGGLLVVKDDGAGLTRDEFASRWMMLGYNRLRHQGKLADQPPKWKGKPRHAFGRNGVGRHGLLCFDDKYDIEIRREKVCWPIRVRVTQGEQPLEASYGAKKNARTTGVKLKVRVERNLPNPDRIRQVIAARFVQDPSFQIVVNGEQLDLFKLSGDEFERDVVVDGQCLGRLYVLDGSKHAHRLFHHGVAFWVNRRLVGQPSWQVGQDTILDGRSREARRYTFVIKADALSDHVQADWSSFKPSAEVDAFLEVSAAVTRDVLSSLLSTRIEEKKETVVREHVGALRGLSRTGRKDVAQIVESVSAKRPTMNIDDLEAVVAAAIELESSRSGAKLLQRLVSMPEEDREALDRLLDDWSIQDAVAVLDEIDRRLSTVTAIDKLCADAETDELHTLHPLVTQSRWLFGPEYDSPVYASNRRIKGAIATVLGEKGLPEEDLPRPLVRPDILVAHDATFSAVGAEDFQNGKPLSVLRRVLLIELKKGRSKIGRKDMEQATGYVEDILESGHLDGPPLIDAFVVGYSVDPRVHSRKVSRDKHDLGEITPVTYNQLVDTANARLFRLRSQLQGRYKTLDGEHLVSKILGEPEQLEIMPEVSPRDEHAGVELR